MASAPIPHAGGATGEGAAPLEVLVQGLAERMEKNPDNLDGWLMLGRTYFAIGQAPKALEAVERAYRLAPEQTSVLIAYAEALAANSGNRLEGRPAELIRTVLAREPGNPSARWLDGMLAYQQERFGDAAETWQGILNELDPAGEEANQMRQMIAEAQDRAGAPGAEAGAVPGPRPPPTVRAGAQWRSAPARQRRASGYGLRAPRQRRQRSHRGHHPPGRGEPGSGGLRPDGARRRRLCVCACRLGAAHAARGPTLPGRRSPGERHPGRQHGHGPGHAALRLSPGRRRAPASRRAVRPHPRQGTSRARPVPSAPPRPPRSPSSSTECRP